MHFQAKRPQMWSPFQWIENLMVGLQSRPPTLVVPSYKVDIDTFRVYIDQVVRADYLEFQANIKT